MRTKIDVAGLFEKIRKENPVVHHLTNWVTISDCAQIVKTLGASPVMAHAREEAADMVKIASSLVLNIGTLTPELVEAMKLAAQSANAKGIPVVLDVCGAGATPLRDQKCLELLREARIDILKGNTSEIARIAGENVRTRGVDAAAVGGDLAAIAQTLARSRKCTVVVTGREDIVTDGGVTYLIKNGHEMMTRLVGTGCMAASVIGTFAAVEKDPVAAAVAGLVCFEVAAELAAERSKGPATFKEKLFDDLYNLDAKTIERLQKIRNV
ncbi:MAG TPA: hydroxyethylthiazole kinase [Candidatus Omnitrophota bacterium]|nr:hydroxyethylthiazole kinase [Candidatus Omnitrophota bacterium]HPS37547.1 hydroxyethylthiazole kinase [Candidatus Omnitrophota bacterium]